MSAASAGTPILGSTASPPRNVSGPARSASVVAGSRSSFATAVVSPTAASAGGTAVVSRGASLTLAAASAVSAHIVAPAAPESHAPVARSRKCVSCARVITIASPFTKPSIAGCGTIVMNLPRPSRPTAHCKTPASTTAAERYDGPSAGPFCRTSSATHTAHAPLAPETMPARPPSAAAKRPSTTVDQSPTSGLTPATNANATASGIIARLTVPPASTFCSAVRGPFGYTRVKSDCAFATRSSTCDARVAGSYHCFACASHCIAPSSGAAGGSPAARRVDGDARGARGRDSRAGSRKPAAHAAKATRIPVRRRMLQEKGNFDEQVGAAKQRAAPWTRRCASVTL